MGAALDNGACVADEPYSMVIIMKDKDDQIACCDWLDEMRAKATSPPSIEQELAKCRAMDIATKRAQAIARKEHEEKARAAEREAEHAATWQEVDRRINERIRSNGRDIAQAIGESTGELLDEHYERVKSHFEELVRERKAEITDLLREREAEINELRRTLAELRALISSGSDARVVDAPPSGPLRRVN